MAIWMPEDTEVFYHPTDSAIYHPGPMRKSGWYYWWYGYAFGPYTSKEQAQAELDFEPMRERMKYAESNN